MSHEGVTLVARIALIAVLIVAAALARVLVGPSKRRGRYMALGGFAGMAFGVFVAYGLSRWVKMDVSALTACIGIIVGWIATWPFARRIPREADCGPLSRYLG